MQKNARFLNLETKDLKPIFESYGDIGSDPSIFFALRHALFDEVAAGKSPPTLWIHNSFGANGILSIGKNESPTRVDFGNCRELGVPVYVRKSGGWHIYNDSNFVFVTKRKRPVLPLRARIGGYGIDWTDDDNTSLQSLYKVYALNDTNKVWCEVILTYYVPQSDTLAK